VTSAEKLALELSCVALGVGVVYLLLSATADAYVKQVLTGILGGKAAA
jgi:hypothetical protein